jgi:hypothetical protein
MIDRAALPSISFALAEMGINPGLHGGRGRSRCPIHGGDNPQAFSYDDDRGIWYCFRCGIGGDVVELVKRSQDVNFVGALKWLRLKPDFLPAPDPEQVRRHRVREGLYRWARDKARELRDEHYMRCVVEQAALRLLRLNPDDEQAWDALQRALIGMENVSHQLDMLEGTDEQKIEIYKQMKGRNERQSVR